MKEDKKQENNSKNKKVDNNKYEEKIAIKTDFDDTLKALLFGQSDKVKKK